LRGTSQKRGKEQSPEVSERKVLKTIFCALVLASCGYTQQPAPPAQQLPLLPAPRAGFSFPQKQTLTYSVDWRVFSAGTAVIRFEQAGDREKLSADANTIGAINMLFQLTVDSTIGFPQPNGNYYFSADLGFPVGTDQVGLSTSWNTVIVRLLEEPTQTTPGWRTRVSWFLGTVFVRCNQR